MKRFLARARRSYRMQRVVLSGSRARGDALIGSDTDLVIVSPDFEHMSFTDQVAAMLDPWTGRTSGPPLPAFARTNFAG